MSTNKTLIKGFSNVTSKGISLKLTKPASLNGGIKSKEYWVSWDKIGIALFGDQYDTEPNITDLKIKRGESR